MPVRPEPKFFMQERQQTDKEYYQSKYFAHCDESSILIEKSTSYIESDLALKQINTFFPNAKLLIMVRNPVERAISNYFFSLNNGFEKRSLEEALFSHPPESFKYNSSVNPFDYLQRGKYSFYLAKVYEIFPKERVHVILFEELINSRATLDEVFSFLGVTPCENEIDRSAQNPSVKSQKVSNELRDKLKQFYYNELEVLATDFNLRVDLWA
jgi:hypothetical protein